ncbi:hypothetical protein C7B61_10205 [filamentous cyanobacterium CCP1]|nr:hypothetical protein C7B76_24400 [filamentous cyanobacterium CCP2]PSB66497.1 hypothetical protein C7B61_10205 [filamentous cyanobacterium CCP1]
MSAQVILAIAQQGDPRAIATLMNCITRPKGVNIRVQEHGGILHILFEAEQLPEQDEAVAFACDSIATLEVEYSKLMIYGRQKGQPNSAWRQLVHLQPAVETADPNSTVKVDTPTGLFDPFTDDEAPQSSQTTSEAPDFLKRPESVIFILLVGILIFWDAYLSLLESVDDPSQTRLSTRELAQRLNTTPSILRHKKRLPDFSDWSRFRDPDGIAWAYSKGTYLPLVVQTAAS